MAMIIGTEKMVDRQPKDSRHRLRQQALLEESLREAEARLATLEERFEAKRRSWLDADAAFNRSLLDAEAAFREELRAIENGWRPLQVAGGSRSSVLLSRIDFEPCDGGGKLSTEALRAKYAPLSPSPVHNGLLNKNNSLHKLGTL
ncbi:hypothetical protein V5799_013422 [Amblyomma americanum]|uniref:Uncharacterized protein n=1 Tax=Amblyomma americanum TaxID=6943 RepID=A0AAQ4E5Y3_AMBAM